MATAFDRGVAFARFASRYWWWALLGLAIAAMFLDFYEPVPKPLEVQSYEQAYKRHSAAWWRFDCTLKPDNDEECQEAFRILHEGPPAKPLSVARYREAVGPYEVKVLLTRVFLWALVIFLVPPRILKRLRGVIERQARAWEDFTKE